MTQNEPLADTVIAAPRRVRQAEIVGALSIATDIGMGQPVHFGLRTAVLSAHLADRLGASSEDASDAYYVALLRYAGCTADADIAADAFGDEGAMRGSFADVDWTSSAATFRALLTRLGEGSPPLTRAQMVAHASLTMPNLYRTSEAHCEVAQQIAGRMGMPHRVRDRVLMADYAP